MKLTQERLADQVLAELRLQELKKIEWYGTARYPWNNWPDSDNMCRVAACPDCGGIKPGVMSRRLYAPTAIGHASNCQLAILIGAERRTA